MPGNESGPSDTLGCKQRLKNAVDDRIGLEPMGVYWSDAAGLLRTDAGAELLHACWKRQLAKEIFWFNSKILTKGLRFQIRNGKRYDSIWSDPAQ